ncbi:hypothetical protein FPCIR_1250 [Fusarium pseudocircinatum]|uniref:Uncharacterized protein n=1 Tax=Fusarium pseudocircinatum TaxID=56676 RepID=A0A8H5PWV1_9HYPO|nr:hypothetical protein FPCIR_1250 [Fusarium pseudocircinatum]
MSSSKRPAETALDSAPATKKRGRPAKNSIEESATAREFAEKISENTRAFRRENADSHIGELIRPPGDGWSQAQEDGMNRLWEKTDHKEAVGGMMNSKGKTTQAHLLTLFKVCLRVFGMSPIRFLSFSHGVEYLGERGSSAIFSKAYSDELARLIVHPAFNGKNHNLAIVMQYAVICRIDDRRLWPDTTSTLACPALTKMTEVMNESENGESENSIHRTHMECRRECAREGKTPSKISDLLFAVGETVKKSTVKGIEVPEEAKTYRGLPVRSVSLYDLKHIKKTLDETTWPYEAWNCTTTEALYSYQLVINQPDAPNGEELPTYYERAHKRKLRDWMLKSNYDPQQQVEEEPEGAGIDQGEGDGGSLQIEDDFQFGGIDQGGDDGGSPIVNAPSNPEPASGPGRRSERPSTPEPRRRTRRAPVETLANVAVQRPGLIPDEYNPYLSVGQGQGVGSPTKSELLTAADIDQTLVPIVEAILQRHRAVTLDMMTDILQDGNSLMNEDWKQGDEDGVEARWQRSERKKSSDRVGTRGKNDDPLRNLWRVCVRFFKQTPPLLFSPFNRLQFVPRTEKDTAVFTCHLFSKEACNAIADLIVHPIWQQDHRHFVNVLTYTANLRVGGTTNFHWLPLPHVVCPVLRSLNATLALLNDEDLPKTIHQLHLEADYAAIEYQGEPSFFSDFMISIADYVTVEKSPTSRELQLMRHNIIPFRITDVECIQKAIDGFAYSDVRLGVGRYVKAVSDAFKVLKRDEVPATDQLREFDFSDREQTVSQSGHPARNTERVDHQSRSRRPSLESRRSRSPPPVSESRSGAIKRPSFPKLIPAARSLPTSSAKITPVRSAGTSHRRSQRERSPPRQQPASDRIGSTQDGGNRAPSHTGAQDRVINDLKASNEKILKRLSQTDRKVEEQGVLIKALQEEIRVLKEQRDLHVPRP